MDGFGDFIFFAGGVCNSNLVLLVVLASAELDNVLEKIYADHYKTDKNRNPS
jgi:hypothetical protein